MAEPTTSMRVSRETKKLADTIARKVVQLHATASPSGIMVSATQGSVTHQALVEFVENHKELGL